MVRVQQSPDNVVIGDSADRPGLSFVRVDGYRPPTWPTGDRPQFIHLDARVADLTESTRHAEELGARRLPGGGENFAVFADPIGHPFCLVEF